MKQTFVQKHRFAIVIIFAISCICTHLALNTCVAFTTPSQPINAALVVSEPNISGSFTDNELTRLAVRSRLWSA